VERKGLEPSTSALRTQEGSDASEDQQGLAASDDVGCTSEREKGGLSTVGKEGPVNPLGGALAALARVSADERKQLAKLLEGE
jgi:hypothetical protein